MDQMQPPTQEDNKQNSSCCLTRCSGKGLVKGIVLIILGLIIAIPSIGHLISSYFHIFLGGFFIAFGIFLLFFKNRKS